MVQLNGYTYEVTKSWDSNGIPLEVTPEEELDAAKCLELFLSEVEEWTEDKIAELQKSKDPHRLYEAYYDLCYIGTWSEEKFMEKFNITKQQLGEILM